MTELTKEERKHRVAILKSGLGNEFWKLLQEGLDESISIVHKSMDVYKVRGMTPENIKEYNILSGHLESLTNIKNLPDQLLRENQNLLDRMTEKVKVVVNHYKSYIGGTNVQKQNGSRSS